MGLSPLPYHLQVFKRVSQEVDWLYVTGCLVPNPGTRSVVCERKRKDVSRNKMCVDS